MGARANIATNGQTWSNAHWDWLVAELQVADLTNAIKERFQRRVSPPQSSDECPQDREHNPNPLPPVEQEPPHGGTLARRSRTAGRHPSRVSGLLAS
jgi:hypothetical protein